MIQDPVPQGREQLKQAALDMIERGRVTYDGEMPRADSIQYFGLRAIAYAILADGEPYRGPDKVLGTFGEPADVGRHLAAPPLPLFTIQWDYSAGPSHPKLQLVDHGDEENLDVVHTWYPGGWEIDENGMLRDVGALAAWVAGGIIDAIAKEQGWDQGAVLATRARVGDLLSLRRP